MSRARILRATLVCAAVAWLGAACQDDLVEPASSPAPRSPSNGTGLGSISLSSTALTASLSPGATFAFSSIPGLDRAYGINDAGLVVGDRGGNNIAAVWTATGGATTIGRLDGTTSCCSGFTDA